MRRLALVLSVLALAAPASAYPEFQKFTQQNSGRTTNCAMCHTHPDGPDGAALWTFERVFELPYSFGEGLAIAATPGGDAVVAGMFMVDASPSPAPWFGQIGQ